MLSAFRFTMVWAVIALLNPAADLSLEAQDNADPAVPAKTLDKEERAPFKRRDVSTEEELRKQLLLVPVVGFDQSGAAQVLAVTAGRPQGRNAPTPPVPAPDIGVQLYHRLATQLNKPEFAELPWRSGVDCQLGKEPAEGLQVYSVNLRLCMQQSVTPGDIRPDANKLKSLMFATTPAFQKPLEWNKAECVPTLAQMLQTENTPVRILLVETLAKMEAKEATVVLAQRAVFDLAPEVREKATEALATRPTAEFQKFLLEALRWPWQPAADHAAEVIVALQMKELVAELNPLLDELDPTIPFDKVVNGKKGKYVKELVRINHLSNCLLCHAPSLTTQDLVRGLVPIPTQAMAPVYYGGSGQFVRADTTFLKQDFSVVQPVANPGLWPGQQRYDYLVRERRASVQEIKAYQARVKQQKLNDPYPQRDALLFALREIGA